MTLIGLVNVHKRHPFLWTWLTSLVCCWLGTCLVNCELSMLPWKFRVPSTPCLLLLSSLSGPRLILSLWLSFLRLGSRICPRPNYEIWLEHCCSTLSFGFTHLWNHLQSIGKSNIVWRHHCFHSDLEIVELVYLLIPVFHVTLLCISKSSLLRV